MKVNIIGQVVGTSGYSSHTRQLALALNTFCDVRLASMVPADFVRFLSDEELVMIKKKDDSGRVNVIIALPHQWNQFIDRDVNIGFLVWEGDRIPKSWLHNILDERIKQVWVPSVHTKNAVLQTLKECAELDKIDGYDTTMLDWSKIRVVPHGVNTDLFYPEKTSNRPFTFLCNKGFRNKYDRGGVQYAVKAFIEEFSPGEARLLVKLNPAYSVDPAGFQKIMGELGVVLRPDVQVIFQEVPYADLRGLYSQADVFLNPVRSEAFSIPCAEALACGLPVITTDYGGQTDFVNEGNGWLVKYDLKEVCHELSYEGVRWAVPLLDDLRNCMRQAFSCPDVLASKSERALNSSRGLTWLKSAETAFGALNELSLLK